MDSSSSSTGSKEQGAETSNASELKDLLQKLTATVEKLTSNVNPPPAKRAKPAAEVGSDLEQDDDYDDDATVGRKQSAGAVMTFNISEETRAFVEAVSIYLDPWRTRHESPGCWSSRDWRRAMRPNVRRWTRLSRTSSQKTL